MLVLVSLHTCFFPSPSALSAVILRVVFGPVSGDERFTSRFIFQHKAVQSRIEQRNLIYGQVDGQASTELTYFLNCDT